MNGMILKVLKSLAEDGRIVPEIAYPRIARNAEDAPDLARVVAVVNTWTLTGDLGGDSSAYLAHAASSFQHLCVLLLGYSIHALAPASLPVVVVLLLSARSIPGVIGPLLVCVLNLPSGDPRLDLLLIPLIVLGLHHPLAWLTPGCPPRRGRRLPVILTHWLLFFACSACNRFAHTITLHYYLQTQKCPRREAGAFPMQASTPLASLPSNRELA